MSVLSHLEEVASNAILSTTENSSINTSISTLQTRLDNYFNNDELFTHFKFGSSTRGTILPRKMDENSDIDYMIVFSDSSYKPQTYLDKLKKFVEARYSTSEIRQSNPVIVLELNHIKFELVPAINKGTSSYPSYYIPDKAASINDWISTNPNDFNQKLTNTNTNNNSQIKPMVRLVKYWNALNGYPFLSFGLEKHIVDQYYNSCTNLKDYFFKYMLALSTSINYSQATNNKITRTHNIINQTKSYEAQGKWIDAENEIKKLIS